MLLAISSRINLLIYNFNIFKQAIRNFSIMLLIVCLFTNQSLSNALNEIVDNKITSKSYKLELIKEFINNERLRDTNIGFLAPENNYIHWKLDESRHGFPHKSVFRNISNGKMDNLINQNSTLNYNFLLPNKNQLCETLNTNGPTYIITKNNDYSFNCLKNSSSKYKLTSRSQRLNENNIFIFKRFNK